MYDFIYILMNKNDDKTFEIECRSIFIERKRITLKEMSASGAQNSRLSANACNFSEHTKDKQIMSFSGVWSLILINKPE